LTCESICAVNKAAGWVMVTLVCAVQLFASVTVTM
jgi:hypothetical protein